jgi:hypothetical protein
VGNLLFLFRNILRIPRRPQLVWATFTVLAFAARGFGMISLLWVFAACLMLTLALAIIEVRQPSYHGVGWQIPNPRLPEWWNAKGGNHGH